MVSIKCYNVIRCYKELLITPSTDKNNGCYNVIKNFMNMLILGVVRRGGRGDVHTASYNVITNRSSLEENHVISPCYNKLITYNISAPVFYGSTDIIHYFFVSSVWLLLSLNRDVLGPDTVSPGIQTPVPLPLPV